MPSVILLVLSALLLGGCAEQASVVELSGSTMGTRYSIKLVELPPGLSADALQTQIDARLERVNDLMSTYRPASALSRFNASPSTDWQDADPALVDLIALAQTITARSTGAFDVTVGPLVNLWGFGPDEHPFVVPDEPTLALMRARVGSDKLETRLDPPALRKTHPDLDVDLSGIAKGHGVDEVAALLDRLGVAAYLVEIGGELRAKGRKGEDRPWRIAIERPDPSARVPYRVVPLVDIALATSGDYRNVYVRDGKHYSHTIDPSTGRPVEHSLASVTVLAPDCASADAWATALLVLGPERGVALAEAEGLAAFFVTREGDDFSDRATTAFARLVPAETAH